MQKAVFHVDNLDVDCTVALLNDYLLANDIQVVSVFKAVLDEISRRERTGYCFSCVCVPAAQRQMVFDSALWDKGVIVRSWQFKNKHNGE